MLRRVFIISVKKKEKTSGFRVTQSVSDYVAVVGSPLSSIISAAKQTNADYLHVQ